MKRINKNYSKEFKLLIIEKYLQGGITLEQLAIEFEIPSKTQVYNWVKKYKKDGVKAFELETRGRHNIKKICLEEPKIKFSSIEEELIFLRIENNYLKKLCEVLKKNS